MTKIRCTVARCIFNCADGCCKTKVDVEAVHRSAASPDETMCASFSEHIAAVTTCACGIPPACEESEIGCAVTECIYNFGTSCTAEKIDVGCAGSSSPSETSCMTFKCR